MPNWPVRDRWEYLRKMEPRALTIWMEFSVIPGQIQMERFIPVESFRKKGDTFRGISFFPLVPEFPKIPVPFVHSHSARLFTVILLRKNAKDLKDGGRFPKRLSLQCVSLLAVSAGGRFRTQMQPCRWKRITLVFFFHIPACFRLGYIVGKNVDADCWFPILGDPGATSRDDAIFLGESLLLELKSPLFLPNQFQKWSNSVPLIGQKNIFLPNQRWGLAG